MKTTILARMERALKVQKTIGCRRRAKRFANMVRKIIAHYRMQENTAGHKPIGAVRAREVRKIQQLSA